MAEANRPSRFTGSTTPGHGTPGHGTTPGLISGSTTPGHGAGTPGHPGTPGQGTPSRTGLTPSIQTPGSTTPGRTPRGSLKRSVHNTPGHGTPGRGHATPSTPGRGTPKRTPKRVSAEALVFKEEVQRHTVHTLVFRSLKRTHDFFLFDQWAPLQPHLDGRELRRRCKIRSEYAHVKDMPAPTVAKKESKSAPLGPPSTPGSEKPPVKEISQALALVTNNNNKAVTLQSRRAPLPKPQWHPPWKLMRVISGHLGWVRCVDVDHTNEWFVTGSADRTIKIWDMASGTLKLSLTGHISTVRGVAVSDRHPYLFSCGEDKQVKCWDLEQNKVIRHYHGHLSAVYSLSIHPTLDILCSVGRDATCRVWDMRTKACVHTLTGHTNTVSDVKTQATEPQIITGSHDCTIRLWDIVAGKTRATLTNHKKSIRSLIMHPTQYTFGSASADNIKQWKCPEGSFIQNLTGHNAILNCLALNQDGVLVSGADNGTLHVWDWKTGYNFQRFQTMVQPGSLDSEAGLFAMTFDKSGSRLITCEADKTIKMYREDETALEEPINWKPDLMRKKY